MLLCVLRTPAKTAFVLSHHLRVLLAAMDRLLLLKLTMVPIPASSSSQVATAAAWAWAEASSR